MARFVYKLQNVLNLKERLEEQQKIAFAEAESKRDEEMFKLQSYRKKREDIMESLKEASMGNLSVTELRHLNNDVKTTDMLIANQEKAAWKAEEEVERQRTLLADAVKERKIHEKLREKAFENFLKEEEAKEKTSIDELVSARYARGEGGMTDGEE
ncbi:MAG: flagellar export protein FliJ [Lachnospiraceae bacterium]|jgi:flagellar FliJ protein|nr:flagellar export protein FliJ [Lachnospiraceae bacterium]MBR6395439.1 flagellar export protein FliJ [Lachnospiraceae bacterium]